jgi:phosphoglycerol transferase MdoB-like AlkP superfamily enzyme
MSLLITPLSLGPGSGVWELLFSGKTILFYAFPIFVLAGHYIERSSIEQMIFVWGGLMVCLTLPAAVVVGNWWAMLAASAPLILSAAFAALIVVVRGFVIGYLDAARNTQFEREETV